MRNILLIFHSSLHSPLRRALAARGLILREGQSWKDTDCSSPECILGAYTSFYEGIRHPLKVWRMRRWLEQRGIPLFTWNRDAPHYLNYTIPSRHWRLYLAQKIHLFDLYATHTLIDKQRTFADIVLYLPNAADIDRYNLHGEAATVFPRLRDTSTYQWDVSFFGGMNGARYKEDLARAEFFAALGERLSARGISFNFRETAGMSADEQVAFIQASRINLNFGARCEYGAPTPSGLPERCYGIPACGGFLLCDKRTHARDDFTPGENWAEFDGLDDCVEKIQYWLAHFDKARDLAERCYTHVINNHTYAHRAETLHNAIVAWHKGKRGLTK